MKKLIKSKKGFTLVELVITMAVISIMIGITINSFQSSIKKYNQSVSKEKVLQAKNSYFASHDINLSDFVHYYFVYRDDVFKGDAYGGLNIFNGFDSVNKSTLTYDTYAGVKIYHPSAEGNYAIHIHLETSVESGTYPIFHTDENLVAFVGTTKNVEGIHIDGYILNPVLSTTQITINADSSLNNIHLYYNKLPVATYTVNVFLEIDYNENNFPDTPNQTYTGSGYLGEYTEVTGIKKQGYTLVEPITQVKIMSVDDPEYDPETSNIVNTYYTKDADGDIPVNLNSKVYINNELSETPSLYLSVTNGVLTGKPALSELLFDIRIVLSEDDGIIEIGDNAFKNCLRLKSITPCYGITTIGDSAFYNTRITSIVIPRTVSTISASAFMNCSSMTTVVFEAGSYLTQISSQVFKSCTSLTTITLPSNITIIGTSAFESCTSLATIVIPNIVKTINSNAFKGCSILTDVTIPNSVTNIYSNAFYGCAFTEITLPYYIVNITGAFASCSNLTTVYYSGDNASVLAYLTSLGVTVED